jgi:VWFA-related protein
VSLRPLALLRFLTFAFLISLCFAQEPVTPPEEAPVATLRSTTRLVVLDVVVTDKSGNPVRNLSKDDFTILEDGKPQGVASFEPPEQHAPVPVGEEAKVSQQAASPALSSSALTILVLDELDTQLLDQFFARDQIRKFLRTQGPRLDQPTALMAMEQKRLELLHDYTRDANELEQALRRHPPELPIRLMTSEGVIGASERLGNALDALREIAAANSHFAGRKNVIWLGPGFPSLNYLKLQPDDRAKLLGWVRETSDLMWQGRLAVYTLDPRGLEVVHENIGTTLMDGGSFAPPDPATGDLVFEAIAPQTGGRIIRGRNDLGSMISASMDDGGSYYTLSYYPSNREWNGRFRNIRVVTSSRGFSARTRTGYFGFPELAPTDQQLDILLSRAVINPLPYHALDVQARAEILKLQQPRSARFTVDLDPGHLTWHTLPNGKHRCEVTLVAASFSSKGQVVSHTVKELEGDVEDTKFAKQMLKPMVFALTAELPPAAVRVRVVARDASNGNIGTADFNPEGAQFH